MLFASLVYDRIPLQWRDLPDGIVVWLQNAGGVSMIGILLVLIVRMSQRDPNELNFWLPSERSRPLLLSILKACIIASGIGYLLLMAIWVADRMNVPGLKERFLPREVNPYTIGDWILTLSGVLALFVTLTPIALDLATRISWSRIWAIARLSWKEAVRGRVIWVFGSMALVFLFADWFVPHKPEDQLRSYVRVVYWSMSPLFLITAGLLGAFSIPNDVKNNSIHTIVTKPVEKFEIVIGRFIGYAALLTIGLFAVSSLSLIYVIRGVNDEAKQESYKARVPLYGGLHFAGTKDATKGESVGREFGYRSYISGQTKFRREAFRQYAIWDFPEIPADVRQREVDIIFEFSFDIFRLSKGEEGKGVFCTFTFADVGAFANTDVNRQAQELDGKTDEMRKERDKKQAEEKKQLDQNSKGKSEAERTALEEKYKDELVKIDIDLISKYRIHQISAEVTDFHTENVAVPAKKFQALLADNDKRAKNEDRYQPDLRVFVNVDTSDQAQMVGVAQQDFYLLAYEKPFWVNFLKGVIGMWCTHMLVLGVAIACSTYLSSVISLLITMFLFLFGMFVDYLKDIAEHRVEGGGPSQSAVRIIAKMSPAAPLDETPTTSVIQVFDNFFSWWIGRILNLIPDINRHDLNQYVANGFDIGWGNILLLDNFLPLVAYLVPWAILAYYQMNYREIANPR
jgi:ABC-type transport system involved in multi-copper enzyme maturation permease subunit